MAKLIIGVETHYVMDLARLLDDAHAQRLNFVCVPLFHPRFKQDAFGISDRRTGPLTRSDMVLDSQQWTSSVVGVISSCLNFDSTCEGVRKASEKTFKQELAWASHLSTPAVLLPTPTMICANYAHLVNHASINTSCMQLWIRVPLYYPSAAFTSQEDEVISETSFSSQPFTPSTIIPLDKESRCADPWEAWNCLRMMCESNPSLGVALEVTADLPNKYTIDRWVGEPIKALILPVNIFLTNRKGFPTLSQRHQQLLQRFFKFKIQVILKGRAKHSGGLLPYQQYIEYLYSQRPAMTQQLAFESPYLDYLQSPLQPLMDNLESQTYETFERDPVKYSQYEAAVKAALEDLPLIAEPVLMVVGAGRGPLVRASLRAAESAGKRVRIYAVEKNPNAVITLRNMKIQENMDNVVIVSSDMRSWDAPEKADILVSELLGSFGDNELSPECLDGAQKFLKSDGVSIPSQYTSFIAPITSSKLWNEVKNFASLKSFETSYVVRLHNFSEIAPAQECFVFHHPNWDEKIDNRRYVYRVFTAKTGATLHGFAGYFQAQLYKDIYISITPDTFSEGMFSWFPLFIPLRTPIYVPVNKSIQVYFWRNVSTTKVWYEWTVGIENQAFVPIHNPNGRSSWIGL